MQGARSCPRVSLQEGMHSCPALHMCSSGKPVLTGSRAARAATRLLLEALVCGRSSRGRGVRLSRELCVRGWSRTCVAWGGCVKLVVLSYSILRWSSEYRLGLGERGWTLPFLSKKYSTARWRGQHEDAKQCRDAERITI